MEVSGKKVLVIGAGRSGVAAAAFLKERGAVVALHDRKEIESWSEEARRLKSAGVGLVPGDAPSWLLDQIEMVVVSPGVSGKTIPVRYAERAGALVIGEVELASRFLRGRIIGITGSNGKTTTTTLVGELLKDAGFAVQVGGNIGTPLVSLVDASRDDGWTVAELSSFQLETIAEFHPSIAVVLNVTPDHLDRYDNSLVDYAAAKHRIFRNQTAEDTAVLNADDATTAAWARSGELRARTICFSIRRELDEGLFLREQDIIARASSGKERVLMTRDAVQLRGMHNMENVLAALSVGLAAGASAQVMNETVRRFKGVEHRLEHVADVNGIGFYNDSKATNVDAAVKALEAFADNSKSVSRRRIIPIFGGRSKEAPYAPLLPLLQSHAKALILIGEDADRIEQELASSNSSSGTPVKRAANMNDAVNQAYKIAEPGDIVLLAPACSSFDMFENYEQRGQSFKQAVRNLRF